MQYKYFNIDNRCHNQQLKLLDTSELLVIQEFVSSNSVIILIFLELVAFRVFKWHELFIGFAYLNVFFWLISDSCIGSSNWSHNFILSCLFIASWTFLFGLQCSAKCQHSIHKFRIMQSLRLMLPVRRSTLQSPCIKELNERLNAVPQEKDNNTPLEHIHTNMWKSPPSISNAANISEFLHRYSFSCGETVLKSFLWSSELLHNMSLLLYATALFPSAVSSKSFWPGRRKFL